MTHACLELDYGKTSRFEFATSDWPGMSKYDWQIHTI